MTRAELQSACELPFHALFLAGDDSYAKPTLNWLLGPFWSWFKGDRALKGLSSWTRRNDCDNFVRAYAQAASDCHATTVGNDDEGLSVGEFWYIKASGEGHAIIIAITDAGRVFIEPQNGQKIILTDAEIKSCFLAKF